jgi:hypothetical protein
VVEQSAAQQEVEDFFKQLKTLDVPSTVALPVSAVVAAAALLALPGVGIAIPFGAALFSGVTKFLRKKKQAEIRDRIQRLVDDKKLPPEEAARLLSEVNRVTTSGQGSRPDDINCVVLAYLGFSGETTEIRAVRQDLASDRRALDHYRFLGGLGDERSPSSSECR